MSEDRERLLNVLRPYQAEKLKRDENKGGWEDEGPWSLLSKAYKELDELQDAITQGKPPEDIARECADVNNFMAMLADNALRRKSNGS